VVNSGTFFVNVVCECHPTSKLVLFPVEENNQSGISTSFCLLYYYLLGRFYQSVDSFQRMELLGERALKEGLVSRCSWDSNLRHKFWT
jgi:hypothetical protein